MSDPIVPHSELLAPIVPELVGVVLVRVSLVVVHRLNAAIHTHHRKFLIACDSARDVTAMVNRLSLALRWVRGGAPDIALKFSNQPAWLFGR